jgi:TPR repeat protein
MTPRVPLLIVVMALSVLSLACKDRLSAPVDVLTDPSLETETLLENTEKGTAEDQYQLGMRYERGVGVPQSYLEAVRWYRLAAMQGYRDGQYKLCEMSERGQGLPQDYQEALRWCGLAADQGHGRAMFILGRLYHTAHGVPHDVVRAHMWYNLAAAHGYDDGKKWRDRLADEMSPSQVAEAQKLAREWNVRMSLRNG